MSTGSNSLYVGSLDPRVCTELLEEVFSLAGKVVLCRVVADRATGTSMRFGFVDYTDHATAQKALEMFNGRSIYGAAMTVDWAHAGAGAAAGRPASAAGEDVSSHFCLFIGNLSSDVTDEQLRKAFSQFGSCTSAKVAREAGATKNHGYAFVSFRDRAAAEAAIEGLDGQVMNNRPLRVDWAKTKTNAATRAAAAGLPDDRSNARALPQTLEHIRAQTSTANVTAYVAGLAPDISESVLRSCFAQYGSITEVRIPDSVKTARCDKLYAFVRYADHEGAARAIYECQDGKQVGGRQVTVHWGRESIRRVPQNRGAMPPPPSAAGPTAIPSSLPNSSANYHNQQPYSAQPAYSYNNRPSYSQPQAPGNSSQYHRRPY